MAVTLDLSNKQGSIVNVDTAGVKVVFGVPLKNLTLLVPATVGNVYFTVGESSLFTSPNDAATLKANFPFIKASEVYVFDTTNRAMKELLLRCAVGETAAECRLILV